MTRAPALAMALMLLAGCGGATSAPPRAPRDGGGIPVATPPGVPSAPGVIAIVGAGGGEFASGGVKVIVPASAVPDGTELTITPLLNRAPGGVAQAFRIETSRALAAPVTLQFQGPAAYAAGTGLQDLGVRYQGDQGVWMPAGEVARDPATNTLRVTTPHLSDWAIVFEQGAPSLDGTFTLAQQVGIPFGATGTVALYLLPELAPEVAYAVTGSITIPAQLRSGTTFCTPDQPTQTLALGIAEVVGGKLRWGLNARWSLSCTDEATGASFSELLGTRFDTMQINLTRCPGAYLGAQVSGADLIQGAYASDCGVEGTVSATWDLRSCWSGRTCLHPTPCRAGVVSCAGGTATCADDGPAPDGTSCGESQVCLAGVCGAP